MKPRLGPPLALTWCSPRREFSEPEVWALFSASLGPGQGAAGGRGLLGVGVMVWMWGVGNGYILLQEGIPSVFVGLRTFDTLSS